jgi:hypothetical protein
VAVEAVNSSTPPAPSTLSDPSVPNTTSPSTKSSTKKVDPNSEEEILNAAVDAFLPSMISNTLTLNNSLFNFAKDAIDEGNDE